MSTRDRALRALAHPLTLTCILLLLINDQILRVLAPSWVTGKLGDVAWLAFAPLVVALPIAFVIDRGSPIAARAGQQSWGRRRLGRTTIALATASIGIIFAVVKAFPWSTDAFRSAFASTFGWTPAIVTDPTDLLTLPALGLAIWIWHRARPARPPAVPDSSQARATLSCRTRRAPALAVLALASLATLGNSGPPDEGIVCLQTDADRLLAGPQSDYAFTHWFASDDGGFTWDQQAERFSGSDEASCAVPSDTWPLELSDGTLIRYLPGKAIERSTDGGSAWTLELRLAGEEARLAYNQNERFYYGAAYGPHAVLVDPATDNLILAMGLEGVLVRDPAGTWHWSAVGPYSYEPITGIAQLFALLQGELALAVAAAAVAWTLTGWRGFKWPLRVLGILAAVGTLGVQVFLAPAIQTGYGRAVSMMGAIAALVITVILGIVAVVIQIRARPADGGRSTGGVRRSRWLRLLAGDISAFVLYLAPFVLWAFGIIPLHATAAAIAMVLTVVVWLGCALTP